MVKHIITGGEGMKKDKKTKVQWQTALKSSASLLLLFSGATSGKLYLAVHIIQLLSPRILCSPCVLQRPPQVLAGHFCRLKRVARGLCASSSFLRSPVSRAGETHMLDVIYWSAL